MVQLTKKFWNKRRVILCYVTVLLSFCYIECELFAVFIKILFDNWRRFCRPSVIYVPVRCPQGGGIWLPEWTLVWAFKRHFGQGRGLGGIWTIIFKKVKCPGVGGWWSFDLTDIVPVWPYDDKTGFRDAKTEKKKKKPLTKEQQNWLFSFYFNFAYCFQKN